MIKNNYGQRREDHDRKRIIDDAKHGLSSELIDHSLKRSSSLRFIYFLCLVLVFIIYVEKPSCCGVFVGATATNGINQQDNITNHNIGSSSSVESTTATSNTAAGGSTTHRPHKINVGFNFASEEAGAKILSSNREAKKASRILNEDSDKYCLIPRSVPKKWIVVELSEEILMKSIAIANYEYYSCSFKHFKVYASVKYPCKERSNCWELLGTFQAANSRKVQHFTFKKPSITRYVKLEFLSHYGESEYYCTLSLLRVHGSTLLEDLKKSLQKSSKKNSESNNPISSAEQTSNNHGNIEYDIKKEEANLNELIKENTEQIVSIHNSDKENSKRLDQLEESFGKLLNDDISSLINEKMTKSQSNLRTELWIMLIKRKFQSFRFCHVDGLNRGEKISFTIDQEKDIINCTCFKVLKKDFIDRVGFLNFTDRGISVYNRSSHINMNGTVSSNQTTISNKNKEVWGVCQYRVTFFSMKCANNVTVKLESSQQTKKPVVKDSKKKPKPIEEENEVFDEKTPMKSTLSHLLNEKQNILKSLFNAIKIHGENENILKNQIKSLELKNAKTFQYIHQILEKNGEDHKLIANSFISLTQKNREQIINDMKIEIENKLKQKIDQFSSSIDQKILKLSEENNERMNAIRREILNYGFIAIIVLLLLIISTRTVSYDEHSKKTENNPSSTSTANIKPHIEIKKDVQKKIGNSSLLGILYSFFFQGIREPVSPEPSSPQHNYSSSSDSFKNQSRRSKRKSKSQE